MFWEFTNLYSQNVNSIYWDFPWIMNFSFELLPHHITDIVGLQIKNLLISLNEMFGTFYWLI